MQDKRMQAYDHPIAKLAQTQGRRVRRRTDPESAGSYSLPAVMNAGVAGSTRCAKHHGNEQQNEMFPKAKALSLDLVERGGRLAARQDELLAQACGRP